MSVGTSRLTLCIGIESIVLTPCDCSPAPTQLISRGFFPCAPIVPTLAVDIDMLRFLGDLFVRMPPNNTAWTETLEAVWARSQYKLETRVRCLYFLSARDVHRGYLEYTPPALRERVPLVFSPYRR